MATVTLGFAEFFLFPGQTAKSTGHEKQLLLAQDLGPLTEGAGTGQGDGAHTNALQTVRFSVYGTCFVTWR